MSEDTKAINGQTREESISDIQLLVSSLNTTLRTGEGSNARIQVVVLLLASGIIGNTSLSASLLNTHRLA